MQCESSCSQPIPSVPTRIPQNSTRDDDKRCSVPYRAHAARGAADRTQSPDPRYHMQCMQYGCGNVPSSILHNCWLSSKMRCGKSSTTSNEGFGAKPRTGESEGYWGWGRPTPTKPLVEHMPNQHVSGPIRNTRQKICLRFRWIAWLCVGWSGLGRVLVLIAGALAEMGKCWKCVCAVYSVLRSLT
jgi:hypothetical protein